MISQHAERISRDQYVRSEPVMRECFLAATKETMDNLGITKYTIEQTRGMLIMLEKYKELGDEIKDAK